MINVSIAIIPLPVPASTTDYVRFTLNSPQCKPLNMTSLSLRGATASGKGHNGPSNPPPTSPLSPSPFSPDPKQEAIEHAHILTRWGPWIAGSFVLSSTHIDFSTSFLIYLASISWKTGLSMVLWKCGSMRGLTNTFQNPCGGQHSTKTQKLNTGTPTANACRMQAKTSSALCFAPASRLSIRNCCARYRGTRPPFNRPHHLPHSHMPAHYQ